ncbi:MAG: hypothetical protein FWD65_06325 [Coriobacteriia bacterium]|nr:hypothetical protein [Coriobacteriia bacterium]
MKKREKIVLITSVSIVALVAVVVVSIVLILPKGLLSAVILPMDDPRDHLETVAWRHDLEPLQKNFGRGIKGMKKCYWKSAKPGDRYPNYWCAGFIVLNQAEFEKLKTEYSWEETRAGETGGRFFCLMPQCSDK